MSYNARKKVTVCKDLLSLCDILSIDISYRKNSLINIIENNAFSSLNFINSDMIKEKNEVNSPLKKEDNLLISNFIYSLGKSDTSAQLLLIKSFRENIEISKRKYESDYNKNSRIYLAFGVFSGLLITLIMI